MMTPKRHFEINWPLEQSTTASGQSVSGLTCHNDGFSHFCKRNCPQRMSDLFENFGDTYLLTYLPMSYTLCTIYLCTIYVRFSFHTYVPTPKSDILYWRSQRIKNSVYFINGINQKSSSNAELVFSIIPSSDETCSCIFCTISFGCYFGIKICYDF